VIQNPKIISSSLSLWRKCVLQRTFLSRERQSCTRFFCWVAVTRNCSTNERFFFFSCFFLKCSVLVVAVDANKSESSACFFFFFFFKKRRGELECRHFNVFILPEAISWLAYWFTFSCCSSCSPRLNNSFFQMTFYALSFSFSPSLCSFSVAGALAVHM